MVARHGGDVVEIEGTRSHRRGGSSEARSHWRCRGVVAEASGEVTEASGEVASDEGRRRWWLQWREGGVGWVGVGGCDDGGLRSLFGLHKELKNGLLPE